MIVIFIGTLSEEENQLLNDLFEEHHIKFYNKITSTDWVGSTGIILSDFVGARRSGNFTVYGDLLPQAIINNNYKYRMKRKGE